MTAEMIVKSPVTAADNAVLGLLDMVQQVRKTCGEPHFTETCNSALCMSSNLTACADTAWGLRLKIINARELGSEP